MRRLLATTAFVAAAATAAPAHATYSVAMADTINGWTGGAVTSCVGNQSLSVVLGTVPSVGAYIGQAASYFMGWTEIGRLLASGKTPADIMAAISAATFDPESDFRQYAAVRVDGQSAAFTGESATPWAGDRFGTSDSGYAYSMQGNILTSEQVLVSMEESLTAGAACDFADELMLMLEAGAQNGEGDSRCIDAAGIPTDSAYMRVVDETGATVIEIDIPGTGDVSAVVAMREAFDAWRADNPCRRPATCGG